MPRIIDCGGRRAARLRRLCALLVISGLICGSFELHAEPPTAAASLVSDNHEDTLCELTIAAPEGERVVQGRILLSAVDGGLLVEQRDGALVTITPAELKQRRDLDQPFVPLNADELAAALQEELGAKFEIVRTKRYIIATSAGKPYAEWCGRMLERLQTAFLAFAKRLELELHEPQQPLVVIVFATSAEYAEYATRDAGPSVAQTIGYYSARTNRILLADLTRTGGEDAPRNASEMQRRLANRQVNVATVVHEATHQLAFNCGLQTRYADNPMWLSEGLAIYCEAPDLAGGGGWRTIGRVHAGRLAQFRDYLQTRRRPASLASLLVSDDRFRDPATAPDAYAESWALTYFLIRERPEQYARYLRQIGAKPRLIFNDPATREAEFRAAFGEDLGALETEFLQFMARLRTSPAG